MLQLQLQKMELVHEAQCSNHIWRLDMGSYREVVPWHNDTSQNS